MKKLRYFMLILCNLQPSIIHGTSRCIVLYLLVFVETIDLRLVYYDCHVYPNSACSVFVICWSQRLILHYACALLLSSVSPHLLKQAILYIVWVIDTEQIKPGYDILFSLYGCPGCCQKPHWTLFYYGFSYMVHRNN